jgi:predicted SAM-dependent methyltransferase
LTLLLPIPMFRHTISARVYYSHLLEHFPKHEAQGFTQECYRVLKPRGIIRVAVPDLERIARMYLQALERALQEEVETDSNVPV